LAQKDSAEQLQLRQKAREAHVHDAVLLVSVVVAVAMSQTTGDRLILVVLVAVVQVAQVSLRI
jgi:hypothetical protein